MTKCEVILKIEDGQAIAVFYNKYYKSVSSGSSLVNIYSPADDHGLAAVDYCESLPDCHPDSKAGKKLLQALRRRGYENIEVVRSEKQYSHLFAAAPALYNALAAVYSATTMGKTVTEEEKSELVRQVAVALAKADGGEYR